MPALQTFAPDADNAEILQAFRRDGAAIISGLLDQQVLADLNGEVQPWIDRCAAGADDFTGRKTVRTGALIARCPTTRPVVSHPKVIALANEFLKDWCPRIQLHLTQTIHIKPGQGEQYLHRDRLAWGGYIPENIEPQFNTIWALTPFTAENGATRVVPGSQNWDSKKRADAEEICQAQMSAGSVLLYSGSVIHSGGRNNSDTPRTGMNITYCLGWLRTEENQFLSCPPEIARDLPAELQELMGYTMGNYALGYYSDPHKADDFVDTRPPEFALGRKPRKELAFLDALSSSE